METEIHRAKNLKGSVHLENFINLKVPFMVGNSPLLINYFPLTAFANSSEANSDTALFKAFVRA